MVRHTRWPHHSIPAAAEQARMQKVDFNLDATGARRAICEI
jgi:hypothetical protein